LKKILNGLREAGKKYTKEDFAGLIVKKKKTDFQVFRERGGLGLGRRDSMGHTHKSLSISRKFSEQTAFFSVLDTEPDDFYDCIDDEAELFCQTELAKRIEMLNDLSESYVTHSGTAGVGGYRLASNLEIPGHKASEGFVFGGSFATKKNSIGESDGGAEGLKDSGPSQPSKDGPGSGILVHLSGSVQNLCFLIYDSQEN
jgi:hypothetical protein